MSTNIVIPSVGESVTSGVIASWRKPDGAYVERDEAVLDLETDKITVEVTAPAAGLLKRIAKEGDQVNIGAVVGQVDESASKPNGAPPPSPAAAPTAPKASRPEPTPAQPPAQPVAASPSHTPASESRATPLAERIAAEQRVDLAAVVGTGAGGRIREQDVLAYIQSRSGPAPAQAPSPSHGARTLRRERMSPLRQRIASRLVEAQHAAAMLTTFNECDMTSVMDLRARHKEAFEKKHGVSLGFMSFFVRAAANALAAFPAVNAYIVADEQGQPAIEKHDYADIAIAVASPKGLVVPVLRSAHAMSFAQVELAVKELAAKAKDAKLDLSDLQGGTFTITNGGIFGSLMSTPILNPPQSAILGMHAIKNRPVEDPARPGQITLRPMMYLALSYDHRIVDGAEAVRFLVHIKNSLEAPERLLLDL